MNFIILYDIFINVFIGHLKNKNYQSELLEDDEEYLFLCFY